MLTKVRENMKKFFPCLNRQGSSEEGDRRGQLRRKMVIVGDGECGKTCLVTRMASGSFVDVGYVPTVFETELVNVSTGQEDVELVIYDTAGQEDYDRLRPLSYTDVDVVLICFSVAEPSSLINVAENWSPEIRYFCGHVPVILVGNKKDLRDSPDPEVLGTPDTTPSTPESSLRSPLSVIEEGEKKPSSNQNSLRSAHSIESDYEKAGVDKSAEVAGSAMSVVTSPPFTTHSRPQYRVQAPVKHSEGALMARRVGALAYFETSALTGDNVQELLLATTKAAVLGSKKAKKFKQFSATMKSWKSLSALAKS